MESGDIEDERQKLQHDIQRIQDTLCDDSYSEYDSNSDSECLEIDLEPPERFPSATDDDTRTRSSIGASSASQFASTEVSEGIDYLQEQDSYGEDDGVAELPITTETTLALNRAYQEVLVDLLKQIEDSLVENRQKQENFEKNLVGQREKAVQSNPFRLFQRQYSIPFIKDPTGGVPPPNEDVLIKKQMKEHKQDLIPNRDWMKRDRKKMSDAVAEDALQQLLQPLMSKLELEQEKLEKCSKSEEIEVISKRIDVIEEDIAEKRATSREDLLRNVDATKVDWMKISNLAYDGRKTFEECRLMWLNVLNPGVNRGGWQPDEDKLLIKLAEQFQEKNWVSIARQLNTGRTPYMCLKRYQTELNVANTKVPWTEEEDKKLLEIVNNLRASGHRLIWSKVSGYMDNRSGMMCYQRFHQIDPNMRRGAWTKEEDLSLFTAVNLVGTKSWARLSDFVQGRTPMQCRDRWLNCLDPQLRIGNWTYEEDKKLLKAAQEFGTKSWKKIADQLTGRSDNMVLQRYKRLENFRLKSKWFDGLPESTRRGLLGHHLSQEEQKKKEALTWHNFQKELCVHQDDYQKQERDRAKGDLVVPRPPPMFGYTTNARKRVVENRLKLQNMIMRHIQSIQKSNNLSTEVANLDPQTQEELASRIQTAALNTISVRKLLQISRDMKSGLKTLEQTEVPRLKRKTVKYNFVAKRKKRKQEEQLKLAAQAIFRTKRKMKKGRPRRFFSRSGLLPEEEKHNMKVKSLNLVMKALDIDVQKMLLNASELKRKNTSQTTSMSTQVLSTSESTTKPKSVSIKAGRRASSVKSKTVEETAILSVREPMGDFDMLRRVSQREAEKSEGVAMDDDPEETAMEAHFEDRDPGDREQAKGQTIKKITEFIKKKQSSKVTAEGKTAEKSSRMGDLNSPRNNSVEIDSLKPGAHVSSSASTSTSTSSSSPSSKPQMASASTNTETVSSDSDRDEEANVQSLPLLPPNVTSMTAFKDLLLNRRKHVTNCGNLYGPLSCEPDCIPSEQVLMNKTEVSRKRGRAPNTSPPAKKTVPGVRGQEILANQSEPSITQVKTGSVQSQKSYKVVKCDSHTIHTISHESPGIKVIKVMPIAEVKSSSGTNPIHNKLTIVPVQGQKKAPVSKTLISNQSQQNGPTKTSVTIKAQQKVPSSKSILGTSILPSQTLIVVPNQQDVRGKTSMAVQDQQNKPAKTALSQQHGPASTSSAVQAQHNIPGNTLKTVQSSQVQIAAKEKTCTSLASRQMIQNCHQLKNIRETDEYKQLRARFHSIFMWPALLSTVQPAFDRTEFHEKAQTVGQEEEDPRPTTKKARGYACTKKTWCKKLAKRMKKYVEEFNEDGTLKKRPGRQKGCTPKSKVNATIPVSTRCLRTRPNKIETSKRSPQKKQRITKQNVRECIMNSMELGESSIKETEEIFDISFSPEEASQLKDDSERIRVSAFSIVTSKTGVYCGTVDPPQPSNESAALSQPPNGGSFTSPDTVPPMEECLTSMDSVTTGCGKNVLPCAEPTDREALSLDLQKDSSVSTEGIGYDKTPKCSPTKYTALRDIDSKVRGPAAKEISSIRKSPRRTMGLSSGDSTERVTSKTLPSPSNTVSDAARIISADDSVDKSEDNIVAHVSDVEANGREKEIVEADSLSNKVQSGHANVKKGNVKLKKLVSETDDEALEAERHKPITKVKGLHCNKMIENELENIACETVPSTKVMFGKITPKKRGRKSKDSDGNKAKKRKSSFTESVDLEDVYQTADENEAVSVAADTAEASPSACVSSSIPESSKPLTASGSTALCVSSASTASAIAALNASATAVSPTTAVLTASATALSNVTLPQTMPPGGNAPSLQFLGTNTQVLPQMTLLTGNTQISTPCGNTLSIQAQGPQSVGNAVSEQPKTPLHGGNGSPGQPLLTLGGNSVSEQSNVPVLGGNALLGQSQVPLPMGNTTVPQNPLLGAVSNFGLQNPVAGGTGCVPMILSYVPGPDGFAHPVLQPVPLQVLQSLTPLPMSPSVKCSGPSNGKTDVKDSESVAKDNETVAKGNETVPKGNETVPKGNDTVPKGNGTVPKGNETVPKDNEAVIKKTDSDREFDVDPKKNVCTDSRTAVDKKCAKKKKRK